LVNEKAKEKMPQDLKGHPCFQRSRSRGVLYANTLENIEEMGRGAV
jgi:uncharacterized radical SAM superfamily Fe-S cluster-containing enzyme